jgi:hypothetical protein
VNVHAEAEGVTTDAIIDAMLRDASA